MKLYRSACIWHVPAVESPPSRQPRAASSLERALGVVVALVPFGLAVSRAASSGQWRDDMPAVRDLGLVAVGLGGGLSTLLTQAVSLLPLGSRIFRASLGSALALAIAAHLLYALSCHVLRLARPERSRLVPVLGAVAALTAGLSPTWQREATVGGGATLAVAAALGAVLLALVKLGPAVAEAPARVDAELASPAGARTWMALGALLGATFAENPAAGLVAIATVAALLVAMRWMGGREGAVILPGRRVILAGSAAALGVALLLLAPVALRPLSPRAWIDVGRAWTATSLVALDVASSRTTALAAWVSEVGLVSLGIGLFGAVTAVLRRSSRLAVAPLLVLVVADTLSPASAAGVLSVDALTPLRSLAVAILALACAIGVREVVALLLASRVPMARAGAVLLVVFQLTLIALTSEEAGVVADRSEQLAAEEWTDQALGALEPSSAILVRSPAVAWRLWAARVTRGERPDVLIMPIPLLDRGHVAAGLLAAEPELDALLRDFALTAEPSEFALSKLADARPLHVELDGAWSKRLIGHLSVDGMWLEFAPQPLGASDRKQATAATLAPIGRVLAAVHAGLIPDASTAVVLTSTLRSQAKVLSALGERDAATAFLEGVAALSPDGATGVTPALRVAKRGAAGGEGRAR